MGSAIRPASRVAIALGSNLGDRDAFLRSAVERLARFVERLRVSSFYETAPVGVGEQPPFRNAAVVGESALAPADLLNRILDVERDLGRERPYAGAPRTLDLDLILYGDQVIETPALVVPHPRFRERRFVLEPLAEIAGDWRDPITGRTVGELLSRLSV